MVHVAVYGLNGDLILEFNITLLPGDGIGPEVVPEAVRVLDVIAHKCNHTFQLQRTLDGRLFD